MIRTIVFLHVCLAVSIVAGGERKRVSVKSTLDGTDQPCYVIEPDGFDADGEAVPLLVSLHTWSGNLEQRNKSLEAEADKLGWIYLFPNFRGVNRHPDACGSEKAQQDILDAVAWAQQSYPIDRTRIYLTGVSGGGHMTMLMVGRHPEIWAAASAWVGISDLAAWHQRHAGGRYGEMMRACCGGAPEDSEKAKEQYRRRSPLTWLSRAAKVPVDIAAGVHDGHKGSVPVRHSLEGFNEIAKAVKAAPVSEEEIVQISRANGRLENPQPSDGAVDATFGRVIHLRRHAGQSRVTIFEGRHEGISTAAIAWLKRHQKDPS